MSSDVKQFDIGFNPGAAINLRGFLISAHYGIGLADLLPVTTFDTAIKNNVIGIS